MKQIIQHLKDLGPEWTAAIALAAQAVIFVLQAIILGWQGWTLRRHAETLEEHTETAGKQAETARLIGEALNKQEKLLDAQNRIMDEQFKFQRRIEAQADRAKVFDLVIDLRTKFVRLKELLASPRSPGSTYPMETIEKLDEAWRRTGEAIFACQKALITSIHLSQKEKKYFIDFAHALDAVERTRTNIVGTDLEALKKIDNDFKDFNKNLMDAGQTPTD